MSLSEDFIFSIDRRQAFRRKRIPILPEHVTELEAAFTNKPYLDKVTRANLSSRTSLDEGRIQVIRGALPKEVYDFRSSAASCNRSGFYASYESYVCPLSYGVWQLDSLPETIE